MNINTEAEYQSADEGEELYDQVEIELEEENNGIPVTAAATADHSASEEESYNSASEGGSVGEYSLPAAPLPPLNNEERLDYHPHLAHSLGEQRPEFLNAPLVHDAFGLVAAQYPNEQCLFYEGKWIDYAETHARASQLAEYLQKSRSFVSGAVVAVMLERSFELVISILAVFKAGGCYLPCDPSLPDDRLKMYLEDAGTKVVIVNGKQAQRAQELVSELTAGAGSGVTVINPGDAVLPSNYTADSSSTRDAAPLIKPENPAYIIFTSGSTGRPKGVVIPHRSLRDHVLGTVDYYGIQPGDASLLTITVNFDPHLMQIVPCLVVGARLIIARPDGHTDAEYLTTLIISEKVTHINTTPSLALVQFRSSKLAECTSLRCVMAGGEPMQREMINMFAAKVRL